MISESTSPLGIFERYLSLWVALCIVAGVGLGAVRPNIFQTIASIEYASVNLVVAVFIWVMIYPMMVNVDFASLKDVGKKPKGLCITLVVNWLIKPFTMAALGILFFEYIFSGLVEPQTAKEYIAGMILLGVMIASVRERRAVVRGGRRRRARRGRGGAQLGGRRARARARRRWGGEQGRQAR